METNPPAMPLEAAQSRAARIGFLTTARACWLVLILATLYVCYFSHLGAIGFVGPDEPRYAWIARAMVETGDWVTPRLYGKPWFEKPPLYYWGAALSFKLFGVSEAAARLPSAVSALLATLALAWLALRIYGAETARWLLLLLPTAVGMIGFSHAAATDMPFSAMFTIAMVAAAVLLRLVPPRNAAFAEVPESTPVSSFASAAPSAPSTYFAAALFGFFLGLAVLAKGPAGIILCGGAIFFWALITKRWREALRLFHPAGIVTFCATALPWYILCAHRNPDFFRVFIIEHNFKRFLTPEFQHIQPFWYYVPIVLAALIPWTALFPMIGFDAMSHWKARRLPTPPQLFSLCWAAFPIVFFSISRSKLPGYILPAIPSIALMLSVACARIDAATAKVKLWTGVLFGSTVLALFAGVIKVGSWNASKLAPNVDVTIGFLGRLPFFIFLIGGVLATNYGATRRVFRAFETGIATIVLGLFFLLAGPTSLDDLSARRFARPYYRVGGVAGYELQRSFRYALSFYFHEELPEWLPGDRQFKWVLTDFRNVADSKSQGLECQLPDFIVKWEPIVVCKNPAANTQPVP